MPYATGRVIHDADSHVMEPADWLAPYREDAALKDRLSLRKTAERIEVQVSAARARKGDAGAEAAAAENLIAGAKGWLAYGAFDPAERTRALDELGFSRQLVFPTSSLAGFRTSSNLDVVYGGSRAANRAMAAFCGDPRLIGVAYVPLDDPARPCLVFLMDDRGLGEGQAAALLVGLDAHRRPALGRGLGAGRAEAERRGLGADFMGAHGRGPF